MKKIISVLWAIMSFTSIAQTQDIYGNFTNQTIKTLDNQQRLNYLNLQYREDGSTIFTPAAIIVFKTN